MESSYAGIGSHAKKRTYWQVILASLFCYLALLGWSPYSQAAAPGAELEQQAKQALDQLYASEPSARLLSKQAKAILVFPRILKAGLVVGGEHGNGVLFQGGKAVNYYESTAVSYGFQAGAQAFSYALFLMKDSASRMLKERDGWEIGVGPSVVLVDQGLAKKISSATLDKDVYAYIFGQKGLMAGVGIQGSKITPLR